MANETAAAVDGLFMPRVIDDSAIEGVLACSCNFLQFRPGLSTVGQCEPSIQTLLGSVHPAVPSLFLFGRSSTAKPFP